MKHCNTASQTKQQLDQNCPLKKSLKTILKEFQFWPKGGARLAPMPVRKDEPSQAVNFCFLFFFAPK